MATPSGCERVVVGSALCKKAHAELQDALQDRDKVGGILGFHGFELVTESSDAKQA
jgi:hypothetical protein